MTIWPISRCTWVFAIASVAAVAAAQTEEGQIPPPARPPEIRVMGKLNAVARVPGTAYRVTSYSTDLRDYQQRYNQDHKRLHPGFGADRLVVIELEITNNLDRPVRPPVFAAALTATDGARTTDWIMDAKQEAFIEESGRFGKKGSSLPAEISMGKTMKVALVFSVSEKAVPTLLEFSAANFRDMPFGDPNRYRPGRGGGSPAQGQLGPRPGGPPPPMRDNFRLFIDLTSRGR